MYRLTFISEKNFREHVAKTIRSYEDTLKGVDIKKFNQNVVDPIKLLFDKNVFNKDFEDVIELEIHRQRDKSNTNSIGYFHQNIFKYIKNCELPKTGWDVIVSCNNGNKIYVEMKNKHNTMNSSSSQRTYITYIKMQNQIINNKNAKCYLVEAIAPSSRNIPWGCSVDGNHVISESIRRVSMDVFYKMVTGQDDAFFQMCMQLPLTIKEVIDSHEVFTAEQDTVIQELNMINSDTLTALYLLAFKSYEGFQNI